MVFLPQTAENAKYDFFFTLVTLILQNNIYQYS